MPHSARICRRHITTLKHMADAPVRIFGWDEEREVWLAARDGEPSFVWVQDFADAYQAAESRDVEVVVPSGIYAVMVADGEAPSDPPSRVRLSG